MNRIKKAPGANRGSGPDSAAGAKINSHPYCTTYNYGLSSLLDQATHRYEHYTDLARIYAAEAEKHRAILQSLQSLIPPSQRGKGGAA